MWKDQSRTRALDLGFISARMSKIPWRRTGVIQHKGRSGQIERGEEEGEQRRRVGK